MRILISVQICGLLLLAMIIYLISKRKALSTRKVKAFRFSVIITFISLFLDALSIILIQNADHFPDVFINIECKAYIITLVMVGYSAFNYLMRELYYIKMFRKFRNTATVVVCIASMAIAISPIYRFYDGDDLYTYGPAVLLTYIFALTFVILTFIVSITFKNKINKDRQKGVALWMFTLSAAAVIQFFHNELLLVGYASALGLTFLFSELENPITYIDTDTGLFNLKGVHEYVIEKFIQEEDFYGFIMFLNTHGRDLSRSESMEILIKISNYLSNIKEAKCFRTDSYTFSIICKNPEDTKRILKNVRTYIDDLSKQSVTMSGISIRYAVLIEPNVFKTLDEFINIYYYIKSSDKLDEIVYADQKFLLKFKEKEIIKEEIKEALQDNRVEVYYQPIYDTRLKCFPSAEALVRIKREDGSIVPPNKFIPIAEECGLIIPLGERIFKIVCQTINRSKLEKYGIKYIEVNLSAIQCNQKELYQSFVNIMNEEGVRPDQINAEITETAQLNPSKALMTTINRFVEYGVNFSLDDFGTGHSNLDYMAKMPITIVKFDYSMTQNYFKNEKTKIIFKHIIPMIKEMGLEIVCEGVETKEQFDVMTDFGIEHIQGFYFSRPLSKTEYIDFIANRNNL